MQCYTEETLYQAFSTPLWLEIFPSILNYTNNPQSLHPYSFVQQYTTIFPQGLAHYKHCVILYSEQEYALCSTTENNTIIKAYSQDNDSIYYNHSFSQEMLAIPQKHYCVLHTKTIYSISPLIDNSTITAFFIPQYYLMKGDATIEIQCFSMLHSFMPLNADTYPIQNSWTLYDLIHSLGIEEDVVRIVFVDAIATRKETPVIANTKVTLFPGIGGG